MNLKELQKEIHETAVQKGWWDQERSAGEIYALIHSEISEAVEEARNPSYPIYFWCDGIKWGWNASEEDNLKPEGELIELADVVIRILDWCEKCGFATELKYEYSSCSPEYSEGISWYSDLHSELSEGYECSSRYKESELESLELVLAIINNVCHSKGWDLWQAVRIKMDFNKTRPARHGGKKY